MEQYCVQMQSLRRVSLSTWGKTVLRLEATHFLNWCLSNVTPSGVAFNVSLSVSIHSLSLGSPVRSPVVLRAWKCETRNGIGSLQKKKKMLIDLRWVKMTLDPQAMANMQMFLDAVQIWLCCKKQNKKKLKYTPPLKWPKWVSKPEWPCQVLSCQKVFKMVVFMGLRTKATAGLTVRNLCTEVVSWPSATV